MSVPTPRGELIDVFADVMDVDDDSISGASNPETVPEWDSLSHVRLIVTLERSFGVKFSNEEIAAWQCLADIEASLSSHEANA